MARVQSSSGPEQSADEMLLQSGQHNVIDSLTTIATEAYKRYQLTGNREDIDLAVASAQTVVKLSDGDGDRYAVRSSILCVMLSRRFECAGAVSDLEEAVDMAQRAVTSTADTHPNRAARLNNLGNMLFRRFETTGSLHDLEQSISVTRRAVAA